VYRARAARIRVIATDYATRTDPISTERTSDGVMTLRSHLLSSIPLVVATSAYGCTTPSPVDVGQDRDSGTSIVVDGSTHDDAGDSGVVSDGSTTGTDGSSPDAGSVTVPVPPRGRVVGYYAGWSTYDRDFQVSELPANRMTHVNYAFANVVDGRCAIGDSWADLEKTFAGDTWEDSSAHRAGNFGALRRLKQANPNLRTLISVGGWTWSGRFSEVAMTATSRSTFAKSCVDFAVEHGFDGIDIDWEYPAGGGLEGNGASPSDTHNYTLLLQALRDELHAREVTLGRTEPYLLTIAAPAGPSLISHLEPAAIASVVDWINVMTYDFHGGWELTTGHNAPLAQGSGDTNAGWNVSAAIGAYLDAGVPAGKVVMGVPFYGRSWTGVSAGTTHGLYRPATDGGPGTWEKGVLDYRDIASNYVGHGSFVAYRDATAEVPYLFDSSSSVFVTYDDPTSMRAKRRVVDALSLGGVMIWDMSSDDAAWSLLDAIRTPTP